MRGRSVILLLLALAVPGCTLGEPAAGTPMEVPPPEGGGFAACASTHAIPMAVPFRSEAVGDALGHEAGVHRLANDSFLWVWDSYEETLREDRVTRVNEVRVDREPDGTLVVCTRVELATPIIVDSQPETYDVAVRLSATDGLPEAPVRVVVNWVAGCGACGPIRGNATASFEA